MIEKISKEKREKQKKFEEEKEKLNLEISNLNDRIKILESQLENCSRSAQQEKSRADRLEKENSVLKEETNATKELLQIFFFFFLIFFLNIFNFFFHLQKQQGDIVQGAPKFPYNQYHSSTKNKSFNFFMGEQTNTQVWNIFIPTRNELVASSQQPSTAPKHAKRNCRRNLQLIKFH